MSNSYSLRLLLLVLVSSPVAAGDGDSAAIHQAQPLTRAHAHNDYEHPRPLLDALDQGFCSFEADIWLVNGKLLVAHDLAKVKPEQTLEALYLDPLRERIQHNGGRLYRNGPTCTLLIDVKSDANSTYSALRGTLEKYSDFLTQFTPTNTTSRAVTVILSGNRAAELLGAEPVRHVALDGRLSDLESNTPATLYPLVSDDWRKHFTWRGEGSAPIAEQRRLQQLVQLAHQQGRRIRFWGTPDSRAGWRVLQESGVDCIGTDNLAGLGGFLRATNAATTPPQSTTRAP